MLLGKTGIIPSPRTRMPSFLGDPNARLSAIDVSGGILLSRTNGQTPAFVHASAANILASGSIVAADGSAISGLDLRPYECLEYTWDFGDAAGTEIFINPTTGTTVNANTDQIGPEAVYCYRSVGVYTITLSIRGKNGSGGYISASATTTFAVSDFTSSSNLYFDSNYTGGSNDGSQAHPYTSGSDILAHVSNTTPSNKAFYFAYGSTFTNAGPLIKFIGSSGVRLAAYMGTVAPNGTNKPILIFNGTVGGSQGCVVLSNLGGHSDVVIQNLTIRCDTGASSSASPFNLLRAAGSLVTDIYLDHTDCIDNLSGSAASMFCNAAGQIKKQFTNCGYWGGTFTLSVGGAAGIAFGSFQYMFWVGVSVSAVGQGTVFDHFINPELASGPALARWCKTSGSAMNFCIEPRSPNFGGAVCTGYISGTTLTITSGTATGPNVNGPGVTYGTEIVSGSGGVFTVNISQNVGSSGSPIAIWTGDWIGGYWCVSDNYFVDGTNGINFGNEQNWNPYGAGDPSSGHPENTGYFGNGCVVERNYFGNLSQTAFYLTGVTKFTARDNSIWSIGYYAMNPQSGTGTLETSGLNKFLQACIYRNRVYRDSAAFAGEADFLLFPSGDACSNFQEFTDNIIEDTRSGSNAIILSSVWADQETVKSVIDRNQYYVPNATGAPTASYFKDGTTAKTLAQLQAASPPLSFDPNATYQDPRWSDPADGVF